jgi:hypothetical protein
VKRGGSLSFLTNGNEYVNHQHITFFTEDSSEILNKVNVTFFSLNLIGIVNMCYTINNMDYYLTYTVNCVGQFKRFPKLHIFIEKQQVFIDVWFIHEDRYIVRYMTCIHH